VTGGDTTSTRWSSSSSNARVATSAARFAALGASPERVSARRRRCGAGRCRRRSRRGCWWG